MFLLVQGACLQGGRGTSGRNDGYSFLPGPPPRRRPQSAHDCLANIRSLSERASWNHLPLVGLPKNLQVWWMDRCAPGEPLKSTVLKLCQGNWSPTKQTKLVVRLCSKRSAAAILAHCWVSIMFSGLRQQETALACAPGGDHHLINCFFSLCSRG